MSEAVATSRASPTVARVATAAVLLLAACRGSRPGDQLAADSLRLERSRCYGSCPAYAVVLAQDGAVRFLTRAGDGSPEIVTIGDPSPGAVARLVGQAERVRFFAFPEEIAADRTLCPDSATDHQTVTVTIYRPAGSKRVTDYRGCAALASDSLTRTLGALRAFEDSIDLAAGTTRWVPPANGR